MNAPPVYRVAHLSLSLACVRLGLGAVGFAAALAAGAEPRAAAVARERRASVRFYADAARRRFAAAG